MTRRRPVPLDVLAGALFLRARAEAPPGMSVCSVGDARSAGLVLVVVDPARAVEVEALLRGTPGAGVDSVVATLRQRVCSLEAELAAYRERP